MFTQNYFALFDLPEAFAINDARLADNYRQLQKRIHPDKFASHTEQEQRLAVQFSAYVNQAYKCLLSPLKRASYLLELRGAAVDYSQMTIAESAFLMRQMQWREALMDVRDAAEPLKALELLRGEAQALAQDTQDTFLQHFAAEEFSPAQQAVAKLFFIDKFLADLNQLEDQLFNEI